MGQCKRQWDSGLGRGLTLGQIQHRRGAERQEAGGQGLTPDTSRWLQMAQRIAVFVTIVIRLGRWQSGAWRVQRRMYSAEEVTGAEQGPSTTHSLLVGGRQRLGTGGRHCSAGPGASLFGEFADDSDEGTIFVFQPLVVGLQFC